MNHLFLLAPPAPIAPVPARLIQTPRWVERSPLVPARRRRSAASAPTLVTPADRDRFLAALHRAATAADAARETGLPLAALLATRRRDRRFDAGWAEVADARLAELQELMLARALATLRTSDTDKGLGHPDVKHSVAIAMWLRETRFPARTGRAAGAKADEAPAVAERRPGSATAQAIVAAAERRLSAAEAALS